MSKDQKIKVIAVTMLGKTCIYSESELEEVLDHVTTHIEEDYEDPLTIEIQEMTQEEFDNLEDFDGY